MFVEAGTGCAGEHVVVETEGRREIVGVGVLGGSIVEAMVEKLVTFGIGEESGRSTVWVSVFGLMADFGDCGSADATAVETVPSRVGTSTSIASEVCRGALVFSCDE